MGRIGCVAIVKNEERHIAEWLAWQLLIGFETVVLLDNGSTDRTKEIAAGFAPRYDVRVIDWPGKGQGFQARAYDHAVRLFKDEFEWLGFFDTDEFLVLDEGLDLKTVLACRPEAAIAIPWRIFGSSGHKDYPTDLVIEAFTGHSTADFGPNHHVKSIIRPEFASRALNPHMFETAGQYVDLLGRAVEWRQPGFLARMPDYAGGRVHHYFTRSWAHWQARLKRGNLGVVRTVEEFHTYDRNELTDHNAARRGPEVRALLAGLTQTAMPRLGIAITTFNRKEMVLEMVTALRRLTLTPFELVICDDGSQDGTAQALRERGEVVISGPNRGIAWNKNRGLYYLTAVKPVGVVLLLDDDLVPKTRGWEEEWISAAHRHGHVNHVHPSYYSRLVGGQMTASSPGLLPAIGGGALAFDRLVLAQIGFMDPRFGRYGHEHTEFTLRAIRAGHGGVVLKETSGERTLFFAIAGGLEALPVHGSGSPADIEANAKVMTAVRAEPVHRHAWRDDAQMRLFLAEQEEALAPAPWPLLRRANVFSSLAMYEQARDGLPAGQLRVTRVDGLTPRPAAGLAAEADAQGFVARTGTSIIFAPAACTKLPPARLMHPSGALLKFHGPFLMPPEIGRAPEGFPQISEAPPMRLTRLAQVLYIPGQVAIVSPEPQTQPPVSLETYSAVLAESFTAPQEIGGHHALQRGADGSYGLKRPPVSAARTAGRYLFLDNMHRGHFGHLIADVLSLAWGYAALGQLGIHDVQVLVYDTQDKTLQALLEAVGIPAERLISFTDAVLLEEMFFATRSYQTQGHISPLGQGVFREVRDHFLAGMPETSAPLRLYLSRQQADGRKLENEDEVAAIFAERGFTVIVPERLNLKEQIWLAANATMLAGPTGSNMFHLAFQKRMEKAFILSSPNFLRFAELFMSAGHQVELSYFLGETEGQGAHAPWRVDMGALETALDEWLESAAPRWVFDIGMAEGNDTAYYLAKGFNVAGVEADAKSYYGLAERFSAEIEAGRLVIHNEAATARAGEIVEFFHHEKSPRISGLSNTRQEFASGYKSYFVPTVDWPTLVAKYGVPHYMKIDIEGGEVNFLSAATPQTLPRYISVECQNLAPVEALYQLGYRRFMLVDQKPPGGFHLPEPQREGRRVEAPDWRGTSGPFGQDLSGEWVDIEGFKARWEASRGEWKRTWFDCHATLA